ncbi:guanylate kinase [Bacillus cereus group sp. BfR-BA-02730]|uniref:guanylate kinase n=1 Tax=Bacillus cereus group sp. BfR-BA-02730 TaxID=3094893 RepID=UPI0029C5F6FF|nr:guanylate kinase [Bacillus cereus group sp. BfR-BA-02730]MDX5808201.1 guanylate kinase [Bacillus cereus group sp. BfR-BA-02730]
MEKEIFILVGPSGSGKTTLGKTLEKRMGIPEVISHTTRKPRAGEVDGRDYYFVSNKTFDELDKIESVVYAGNSYCVSRGEIDSKLTMHDRIYVVTDINGAMQVKKAYGEIVTIIFISLSLIRMAWRMFKRRDSFSKIKDRILYCIKNKERMNHVHADYIVVNNNFERSVQELNKIVSKKIV